jgi:hypothetical protein
MRALYLNNKSAIRTDMFLDVYLKNDGYLYDSSSKYPTYQASE